MIYLNGIFSEALIALCTPVISRIRREHALMLAYCARGLGRSAHRAAQLITKGTSMADIHKMVLGGLLPHRGADLIYLDLLERTLL